MPLYIGDYLADTARLTTEQHGAYLLLLMDYWRSGKLPDNDQVLAQISKLSPDAWSNAKAMLLQFFSIEDGYLVHARVEKELSKAIENKDKFHNRATKAAEARWNKNATSIAKSITIAKLEDVLEECPSPSPSPSPSQVNNTNTLFDKFYQNYPKKVGKPKALQAFKKIDPDENLFFEMLQKLEIQKSSPQWSKNNGEFIPHPSTWLNNRRWEDELQIQTNSRPNLMAGAI